MILRRGMGDLGFSWSAAIAAGASAAPGFLSLFRRQSGQQKRAATSIVEQIEPLMQRNLEEFLANPSRTRRAQAIDTFDALWQELVRACGDPQLGDAGRRCIDERRRGGRWDWFAAYRDPIANWGGEIIRTPVGVAPAGDSGAPSTSTLLTGISLLAAGLLSGGRA